MIQNDKQKIRLIVNADDFGVASNIDRGIVNLINKGIVTSISVMVNTPTFVESSRNHLLKLIDNPIIDKLSIGLHLNLTEGTPISKNTKSLVTKDNKLFGKKLFHDLMKQNQLNKRINIDEIKSEILEQIKFFIDQLKIFPSHIDGHQHVHIIPEIANVLSEIMVQNKILKTRIPIEEIRDHDNPTLEFKAYVTNTAQISRKYYDDRKIKYPKYFGNYLMIDFHVEVFEKHLLSVINTINATEDDYMVELMCHPGDVLKDGEIKWSDFDASPDRFKEMQVLNEIYTKIQNNSFKNFEIELVSYRNL